MNIKTLKIVVVTLALMVLPLFSQAQTEERILNYHSEIEVHPDSSMTVTEQIRVVSLGDQIRRGIYRDFPIAYADVNGNRYFVGFDILEITRNGQAEPYSTERSGNGMRIYIGDEDVLIPNGVHEYSIKYNTTRQLGFFENFDELYWNVTGNGWAFPIDSASARVSLPDGITGDQIQTSVYVGPQGSVDQNASAQVINNRVVEFKTLQPLGVEEGLTIAVSWPKGIVTPPTETQNLLATLWSNLDYIIGTLGLLIVALYYSIVWLKKGKDPSKGTVIAQYQAPRGYSPAFLSYVKHMGSAKHDFASSIISLGVKGGLNVTETQKKSLFKNQIYTLTKKPDVVSADVSVEEKVLYDEMFKDGQNYELSKDNIPNTVKIKKNYDEALKNSVGSSFFVKNGWAIALGVILSFLTLFATFVAAGAVRYSVNSVWGIIFWPIFIFGLLALNIIFGIILKKYTIEGRKLMDEIEGFELFMKVTEKERLAFHNPPEQTPALFEKFLPYALALGVEHEWAEQFSSTFAKLQQEGVNYNPIWYAGTMNNFTPTAFASEVGNSFTGVVIAAATVPGSSSGSGGGGSSGGGGGGGGGGGW